MKRRLNKAIAGFTLVEMLVVIAIMGILAAISAPSWLSFLTRQRVNAAQAEALSAMRQAQANAKREKREWQACFWDDGTNVKWAVTPTTTACSDVAVGSWNNLIGEDSEKIAIDTATASSDLPPASNGFYRVAFQYKGLVADGGTGKITFGVRRTLGSPGVADGTKRCVRVETLLGAMSTAQNNECTQ